MLGDLFSHSLLKGEAIPTAVGRAGG